MEKEGEVSYAYMFHHYLLVRDGGEVGRKLEKPATTPVLSAAAAGSGGELQTPPNVSTPAAPPGIRPRGSGGAPDRQPNREAVKRNLEASFPSPKRQNTGAAFGGAATNGVAKNLAGGGNEATHQVAAINPYMNMFKIKVGT